MTSKCSSLGHYALQPLVGFHDLLDLAQLFAKNIESRHGVFGNGNVKDSSGLQTPVLQSRKLCDLDEPTRRPVRPENASTGAYGRGRFGVLVEMSSLCPHDSKQRCLNIFASECAFLKKTWRDQDLVQRSAFCPHIQSSPACVILGRRGGTGSPQPGKTLLRDLSCSGHDSARLVD